MHQQNIKLQISFSYAVIPENLVSDLLLLLHFNTFEIMFKMNTHQPSLFPLSAVFIFTVLMSRWGSVGSLFRLTVLLNKPPKYGQGQRRTNIYVYSFYTRTIRI